jgi:hypothetical protein
MSRHNGRDPQYGSGIFTHEADLERIPKRHYSRDTIKRKAKPGRLFGVVLQETDTPALTHAV